MLIVTPAAEAAARSKPIQVHGREYIISEYIGSPPKRGIYVPGNEVNDDGRPQGFLVHQPPNATTPAHFHEPNQFQVFVGGNGRLGAAHAPPLTVQYANGHTPYGPIVSGEEGVKYFTLRQRWDPGAKYLPASNHLLQKGRQRRRIKPGIGTAGEAARKARTSVEIETAIEPESDGLASWVWRMGPGSIADLPDPSKCGGQYLIVAAGSLIHDGRELDQLSTIYVTPEEHHVRAVAGDTGLDLLVLQFPRIGEELTGSARNRAA